MEMRIKVEVEGLLLFSISIRAVGGHFHSRFFFLVLVVVLIYLDWPACRGNVLQPYRLFCCVAWIGRSVICPMHMATTMRRIREGFPKSGEMREAIGLGE